MVKTFTFKTKDGRKARVCNVSVKWDGEAFSACGDITTPNGRFLAGGQCLDHPLFRKNTLAKRIVNIWKDYHLNDMTPGTPAQMKCLKDHKAEIIEEDGWYTKECNLLEKYNLLVDNGYKYGTGWLLREIPTDVKQEIEDIMVSI